MARIKCEYCGCTDFDMDYEDYGCGTYDQHSLYVCCNCGATVTIFEADREPHWCPPDEWDGDYDDVDGWGK